MSGIPLTTALGKNTTGGNSTNDFQEADQALKILTAGDNITALYSSDGGSKPKTVRNYKIFKTQVDNVPIDESTNNTNFYTGILWDMSDDTNGEYDLTENETLVFITQINEDAQGKYGAYDYEIKVPYLLQESEGATDQIALYLEVR